MVPRTAVMWLSTGDGKFRADHHSHLLDLGECQLRVSVESVSFMPTSHAASKYSMGKMCE
jgi:hypothetical protein